jgi:hypothetical protein
VDMALAATRSELVHEDGDVAPGSSASPNSWGSRLRARIPCDAAVRTEVSSAGKAVGRLPRLPAELGPTGQRRQKDARGFH